MATTWKKVITSGSNAELGKLTTTVGLNISDLPTGNTESRVAVLGNAALGPAENSILAITQSLLNSTDTTFAANDATGISLSGTTFNIVEGNIAHDDTYHPTMTNSHIKWQDVQGSPINQANITNSLYAPSTGVGIFVVSPTMTLFNTDATGQVWTSLGTADAPLSQGSIASGFGTISTTGSIGTAATLTAPEGTASALNQVGVQTTIYSGIPAPTPGWNGGTVTANLVSVNTMSVTSLLEIEGIFNIGTLEFTEDVVSHMTASQTFGGQINTHSHQWTGSFYAPDGIGAQALTGSGALLTNLSNNAYSYSNLTIGNGLSGSYAQTFDYGATNVLSVEINNTGSGADLNLLSEFTNGGENAYRHVGYHSPEESDADIASVSYPGSGLTTITLTSNIGGEPSKRGAYHVFSTSNNLANALVPYKHYRLSITCKTSLGSFQIRASNGAGSNFYAGYGDVNGELTNTAYKTFTFDVSTPGATAHQPYLRIEKMSTVGQVVTVSDITCHEIEGLAHEGEVEYSNGAGSVNNIYGIQIGNQSVKSQSFGALAVTTVKIKDEAVTFNKLHSTSISESADIGAIDNNAAASFQRKLLTSIGGNTPEKTQLNSLKLAIENELVPLVDWTNSAGTVTSVGVTTSDITEADGLELSISGVTTVNPTITLQEVIGDGVAGLKVNNSNWTGSVLSVANGGTGASSQGQAAANIFSQTMATDGSVSSVTGEVWTTKKLSIGNVNDTIHISGSLIVQGSDTTINSADYKTKDRMIILAEGDANSYTDVGIKFGRHEGSSNTLMFSNQAGVVGQKGRLGFGEFDFDTNGTGTAQADGTLTSYNAIGVFHTSSATSFAEASTSAALVEANQDGNILVDNAGDIYFHM